MFCCTLSEAVSWPHSGQMDVGSPRSEYRHLEQRRTGSAGVKGRSETRGTAQVGHCAGRGGGKTAWQVGQTPVALRRRVR